MTNERAAYFYPATKTQPATFDVVERLSDGCGRRLGIETVVTIEGVTKREARGLAEVYNATPWNF